MSSCVNIDLSNTFNTPSTLTTPVDGGWSLLTPPKDVKSWVWQYFKRYNTDHHVDKKGFVHCTVCFKSIKYEKSTSKLQNHLFHSHRELYDSNIRKQSQSSGGSQRSVENHVMYGGDFMNNYLKWVINTYKPFDTCNEQYFRDMCRSLNPKAKYIERKSVTIKAAEVKVKVEGTMIQ